MAWWDSCSDGDVGRTLLVRMALLRLLSNSKVMGSSVLRPAAAQSLDCEMVTFDRGFLAYPKLKLRLLDPAG